MPNIARKRNRSRRNRWILISAVAILVVLISVLAYISSQYRQPLQDSSKYFAISGLAGLYRLQGSNNLTKLITQFDFSFTPVGGDATDVRIIIDQVDTTLTSWEGTTIRNGTSTLASANTGQGDILPAHALPSTRQSDGTYTLTIRILADEAEGNVILHFSPDSLFGT